MLGFGAIAQTPIAALPSAGGVGTNITPDVGALALNGFAPSLAQPISVSPNAGTLTFAGYEPAVAQPIAATPAAGTLTLSGAAPALTQTANQSLTPTTGAMALTGQAPNISQPISLQPGVGALALNGFAPSITQGGLSVPTKAGGDDVPRERIEVWTTRKAKRVERKVREQLHELEALAEEAPEIAPMVEAIAVPQRAAAPDWSAYVMALQAMETQLAQVRAELEERDEEEALLLLLS